MIVITASQLSCGPVIRMIETMSVDEPSPRGEGGQSRQPHGNGSCLVITRYGKYVVKGHITGYK